MNYRSFGKTDLKVSELGLGCASLGGGLYYNNERESLMTLSWAFDSGINFYDTSDIHTLGNSQRIVGKAFKGKRDKVIIGSKSGVVYSYLGRVAMKMRPLFNPLSYVVRPLKGSILRIRATQRHYDYTPEYIKNAVEKSLKLLQTDYIDLFQLYHPPTSILLRGEFTQILDSLRIQGKIRYYGVSCATVEDALISINLPGISSVQIYLSLLDQTPIKGLLPVTQEKGIAVIANHPRAMGLLTDTHRDLMGDTSYYTRSELEDRLNKAKALRFLITKNRSLAQAAIQFVLQQQGVSVAVPRAINHKELEENLGALTVPPLTEVELARIYSMSQ